MDVIEITSAGLILKVGIVDQAWALREEPAATASRHFRRATGSVRRSNSGGITPVTPKSLGRRRVGGLRGVGGRDSDSAVIRVPPPRLVRLWCFPLVIVGTGSALRIAQVGGVALPEGTCRRLGRAGDVREKVCHGQETEHDAEHRDRHSPFAPALGRRSRTGRPARGKRIDRARRAASGSWPGRPAARRSAPRFPAALFRGYHAAPRDRRRPLAKRR